jgi:hypothetical protein
MHPDALYAATEERVLDDANAWNLHKADYGTCQADREVLSRAIKPFIEEHREAFERIDELEEQNLEYANHIHALEEGANKLAAALKSLLAEF